MRMVADTDQDRIEDKNKNNKENLVEKFNRLVWIEKYRPTKINQILLEINIRKEINRIVIEKEVPNLIITGKPGIGKTTTIKCLARELYGPYYDQFVLELNASDERGIKIENDIAFFCKSLIVIKDIDIGKYPVHKWVILDEADNITEKAQLIISKLMGFYKDTTRFAFTCNTSHYIIESIQSRCNLILRYQRVKNDKIIMRLQDICDIENAKYDLDGLETIADLCEGDMRSALNIMELTFRKHSKITTKNIDDVYDKPQKQMLKLIIDYCIENNSRKALKSTKKLCEKGYTGIDIVTGIFSTLKSRYCDNICGNIKITMCEIVSESSYNMTKGLHTDLQLYSCILTLSSTKYDNYL